MTTTLATLRTSAGALALGCALATAATAQETVLNYSSWFPETHSTNAVLRDWIAKVEEATEGRVTVEYLPKTVQTPRDQFDVVVDGLADIVIVLPGYTPGRFPVLEIGELPLLVETDEATLAPAFYRLYEEDLAATEPFKGAKVLTTWASAPTHIATGPGPVTSMEEMQGLKIRAPSATAGQVIDAMGAVTVQKPVTEIYELASSGIVDGTFFSYGPMISWKTKDIFENVTLMPGGMGQSVIAVLMNQAKFDGLSEADRQAIMDVSGEELARAFGAAWQNDEDVALAELGNLTVVDASPEFLSAFEAAIEPVETAWVEKAAEAGLADPAATLEKLRTMLEEARPATN
jgi:TRAP-type C4-dicarboxylate transport system substrate-binding protein